MYAGLPFSSILGANHGLHLWLPWLALIGIGCTRAVVDYYC